MPLATPCRVLLFLAALFACLPSASAQQPQLAPPFSLTLEVLTDTRGADLRPFLEGLYKSVKTKAMQTLPKSVAEGEQGTVVLQLRLLKNGKLAVLPRIIRSSKKKALDHAAVAAIRGAVPFDHLPDSAPAPIELALTFYYNVPPPPARDAALPES